MNTMFDTLLQLPLFQGLTQENLTSILERIKLNFDKCQAGETLLQAGNHCDRLVFILKGELLVSTLSEDASYSITEYTQAPYLIEPQSLFGMSTSYISTYVANSELHTVSISKDYVMKVLFEYYIFQLNYLNIISNRAQTQYKWLWKNATDTLEERILHFILSHTERPTSKKILKINQETLARLLNTSRAKISLVLNDMQAKGTLELRHGEIIFPEVTTPSKPLPSIV